MTFVQWIIARRAAYDTLFCGHRPNKDMEKMKVTRRHHIHARGWCWTDFKDGRSKLVLLGLNASLPEGYQRSEPVKPESIEPVKPEPKT